MLFRTYLTEKKQLGDDYNPEDYRDQIKGQSSVGAFMHLLKGSLGFGILSMPMAFYNGGLLFSMIATLIVGFLCAHCVHILVSNGSLYTFMLYNSLYEMQPCSVTQLLF